MKKFSTYLLVMFMILFWLFRIAVTLSTQLGNDFLGVVSSNTTIDIILLFVSIVCIILIAKTNLIGAILYLLGYGLYLGPDVISSLTNIIANPGNTSVGEAMTMFTGLISIVLALAILIDSLIAQKQKINPKDKKTDWFFKNEQFDRKYDERADRNQYKNL